MGKIKEIREKCRLSSKIWRTDSKKPLIEHNNNIQDAYNQDVNGYDNASIFNTHEEQCLQPKEEVTLQELPNLLEVQPVAISSTSEDGFCCSKRPEPNSGQQNHLEPDAVHLIQKSVSKHFPEPPADLDKNLQQHLMNVQNAVLNELLRLGPMLSLGLMGCLIDCYHRQTCDHLHSLLQDISSPKNLFVLFNWGLKTYLSQELLGHPDLQKMDPINQVDLLLFRQWEAKAKDKLLTNMQKEVSRLLEKILQNEKEQESCNSNEAYVGLYVDTIQCIDPMTKQAKTITPELFHQVQEICFEELLIFVRRYKDEQTEILEKKAKMDQPKTIHFFKTLKTCKELKQYIQTNNKGTSLLEETVQMLENLEAFTLKLLMDIVADIAKNHLKNYFNTHNKLFFLLIDAVKRNFPKLQNSQDIQERVMDEAYKVIVHIYVEHLIKTSQSKLKKCWSRNIGRKVTEDVELLHYTISDLAPGVQQWNLILLKITEVLDCNSNDGLKMIVAEMQIERLTKSEDPEFLHNLLRWKGLSKRDIREVLDAIPDDYQPRHRSTNTWYSCLICK